MNTVYKRYLKRTALILTGSFILLTAIYVLMLWPLVKEGKLIRQQIEEKKQLYNFALEASQPEFKVKLNERIEYFRDGWKDFVIESEDSTNLTLDIGQIAEQRNVGRFRIRDKSKSIKIPDCDYIRENQIDVGFTAGFNVFAAALNDLERHRPVIFVDQFSITRSKDSDSANMVDLKLSFFTRNQEPVKF